MKESRSNDVENRMRTIDITNLKLRNSVTAFLLLTIVVFLGAASTVLAHGGEDHSDEKPKTATTAKGTVLHTSQLGDFEVVLKHPNFESDTATMARFFVTKFETNEGAESAVPTIELEAADGAAVARAEIKKTDAAGSFIVEIPALPEGVYTVRVNLTYDGATDTATFTGVEIARPATATADGASSWVRTVLQMLVGAFVLSLFGVLFYFAWRMAGEKRVREETVSV